MSMISKIFKPTPSQIKGDATTVAAREIMNVEVAARQAKTDRLRAERLAHEEVKGDARNRIDAALVKETGTAREKADRRARLTEFPDRVRAKRRQVGLE